MKKRRIYPWSLNNILTTGLPTWNGTLTWSDDLGDLPPFSSPAFSFPFFFLREYTIVSLASLRGEELCPRSKRTGDSGCLAQKKGDRKNQRMKSWHQSQDSYLINLSKAWNWFVSWEEVTTFLEGRGDSVTLLALEPEAFLVEHLN